MNLQEEANLVLQDLASLEKSSVKFEAKKADTLWTLKKRSIHMILSSSQEGENSD